MSDLASQLLDAHVAHVCAQLEGAPLQTLIESEVDALLELARVLKLKDAISPTAIKQTVHAYAVQMELGGGVPELVGEIAAKLYTHKVHDKTTLGDLMPDRLFEEFLDKALELKELRERIIHESVSNPIYSKLISELLYSGIKDYVASSAVADKLPGARSALNIGRAALKRARPDFEERLEDSLKAYVHRNARTQLKASEQFIRTAFESDEFRSVVLDFWAENKDVRLSELREYSGVLDIEDFYVLGYDLWRHVRTTRFYSEMINAGIDAFFSKYRGQTLQTILDDVGVTRDMMIDDALRFAPPVLEMLRDKGLLEPMVRRHLESFYRSDAVAGILARHL